jgi:hypothetical protein
LAVSGPLAFACGASWAMGGDGISAAGRGLVLPVDGTEFARLAGGEEEGARVFGGALAGDAAPVAPALGPAISVTTPFSNRTVVPSLNFQIAPFAVCREAFGLPNAFKTSSSVAPTRDPCATLARPRAIPTHKAKRPVREIPRIRLAAIRCLATKA